MTKHISVSREGATTHVRLSRPEKLNAFSPDLVEGLHRAVEAAASDGTRLLVLSGEGKGFSGGFDLDGLDAMTDGDLLLRFVRVEEMLQAVYHAPFVTLWGSGRASRDFLYVEDAAEAIVKAASNYDGEDPVNLGSGQETSIERLANLLRQMIGYTGRVLWDQDRPDGQPRRCLSSKRARRALHWTATTTLRDGLQRTIEWYRTIRNQSKASISR